MNYSKERDLLLAMFEDWRKCPSVCREGKYFYYRRSAGIAYRVVQDRFTDNWFLHITQN